MLHADISCLDRFLGVNRPLGQSAYSEVIFIVKEQFLQTRPRYIYKLDFCFERGGSGRGTFGDILPAAAGGLYHLIDGAIALRQMGVSEIISDVIDTFRLLENYKIAIIAFFLGRKVSGMMISF